MSDASEQPLAAELAEPRQSELRQPPLSIAHLMLWIFGAAAVLAVYQQFAELKVMTPHMRAVMVGNRLIFSILGGINVAAVIVYARRLVIRDAPLLVQPGHWMLAIGGVVNMITWLLYAIAAGVQMLRQEGSSIEWTPTYQSLPYAAGCLLASVLGLLAAAWQREPLRWRLSFLLSALFSGLLGILFVAIFYFSVWEPPGMQLYSAYQGYSCLYPLELILGFLLLSFNLVADRVAGTRRDWVHGVGVVSNLLQSVSALALHWLWQWAAFADS